MATAQELQAKLQNKLRELFQLNEPDLDFGFYRSASEAYLAENHDAGAQQQTVLFEEPPSGGFSRAIWLEYANQ